MTINILKLTLAAVTLATSGLAASQSLSDISAHRGLDGRLTQSSRQAIAKFANAAAKSGEIRLWVAFDMDFQGDMNLRTQEVVQAEAEEKQRLISEIILPMDGVTLAETPANLSGAPGCMVIANPNGVAKLAQEKRIIHISHHPLEEQNT